MTEDTDFNRLEQACQLSRDAARMVSQILHRLYPPGAAVTWQYNGQRCDGIVTAFSGPTFGARLQVHLGRSGHIVTVRPASILRAAALAEGCAIAEGEADTCGSWPDDSTGGAA